MKERILEKHIYALIKKNWKMGNLLYLPILLWRKGLLIYLICQIRESEKLLGIIREGIR